MVDRHESRNESNAILLPCPFCGSKPNDPVKEGGSDERNGYNFSVTISCKCGASISRDSRRDALGWCNDTGQARMAVVAAWNKRAMQRLYAALSEIDYLCGEPNDMRVSGFDVHYNEDAVVEHVKKALAARSARKDT